MLAKSLKRSNLRSMFRSFSFQPSFGPRSEHYNIEMFTDTRCIHMTPKTDHKYSLIFLHGLGDTAMGFLDLFEDK